MDLTKNANRFSGKLNVELYDRFRPTPPPSLIKLVRQYLNGEIEHVVDIGCGSGLSTAIWKDEVNKITAVDPSADMLAACMHKLSGVRHFEAIQAFGHDIPLVSQCADLITCSQAFHWMDPRPTIKEVNRLLKNKGLFVVFDCLWPPSIHPVWETAFIKLFDGIKEISENQPQPLMYFWDKENHVSNVRETQLFNYVKQVGFDQVVVGDAEYFIGLAESQGGIQALRKIGMSDDDIGWNKFKQLIIENPLPKDSVFILHYSVIIAVKY